MAYDWRQSGIIEPPKKVYQRRPPKGNIILEVAYVLERYRHGHKDFEACDCCIKMARAILPDLCGVLNAKFPEG